MRDSAEIWEQKWRYEEQEEESYEWLSQWFEATFTEEDYDAAEYEELIEVFNDDPAGFYKEYRGEWR